MAGGVASAAAARGLLSLARSARGDGGGAERHRLAGLLFTERTYSSRFSLLFNFTATARPLSYRRRFQRYLPGTMPKMQPATEQRSQLTNARAVATGDEPRPRR